MNPLVKEILQKKASEVSFEMYNVLKEVEAHSRLRLPIKKVTWLKVCAVLRKVDGIYR